MVSVRQSVSHLRVGEPLGPTFPKFSSPKSFGSLAQIFCSVLVFASVPTFLVSVSPVSFVEFLFWSCGPPFILLILPLVPTILGVVHVIIDRLTLHHYDTLRIDVGRVIRPNTSTRI